MGETGFRQKLVFHLLVVRPKNVERVLPLVMEDRRLTIRAIARKLVVSLSAVYNILTVDLDISKLSAK
jgi:hypothetical protein